MRYYIENKKTVNEAIEIWNKSSKNYYEMVDMDRIDIVINKLENEGYIFMRVMEKYVIL